LKANFRDGVLILGRSGRVLFVDPEAADILRLAGLPSDELVGKNLSTEAADSILCDLWHQFQAKGEQINRDYIPGDDDRAFSLSVEPFSLPEQEGGALFVVRDLTALRRLEQIQRDFVANVSHELRTPLTSIRMAAESLQLGAISDQRLKSKFLSNIQREADRLTRLVNELLILARIDGKTPLKLSLFDPCQLFQDVFMTMEHHSELNDIRLNWEVPESLPQVEGDRDRLNQVFINLVDNAIKCNRPGGSVTLFARPEADVLRVGVIDTGIGIPPIDLPHIFDRFYRVDKARSRVTGGTGLGLSIVKDLIEAHGGKITVDSQLDVGTTFTIHLPWRCVPQND